MRLREVCVSVVMCLTLIAGAHAQGPAIKTVKPGVLTVAIDNDMPYCKEEGGKIIGVSWYGGPLQLDVDLMRERSLRYLFPDISTQAHLEHTVRLVATGRVRLTATITHVLDGIESVPRAFEITANKGKYKAINPAQVMITSLHT